MTPTPRSIRPASYAIFFFGFALILFLAHSPYVSLPFFWDELGQFVPAALDLYHDGSLVPHSAVPNVHPPGVMAYLAALWKITGYSIPATRSAMLFLGVCGVLFAFLLAIHLSRGLSGAPAFFAVLLLLADPLFYAQSMLAQLDMPAMVFTLAGLLLFLQNRHRSAALACVALVLAKETGVLLPLFCAAALLLKRGHERQALWYLPPCIVLAGWLVLLRHTTGNLFGDPGFAHYNIAYSLQPVHAGASIARRIYYLFIADGRWIAAISIYFGVKRSAFTAPGWRFAALFATAHVLLVSLLGGAELERYLLPALPILYIATAAAWATFPTTWRNASALALAAALLLGLFLNPPYPFPYENNLAVADFVELHRAAARYVEQLYPEETIYTAWPLTAALRTPEFGYVRRGLKTFETSDFHLSTLSRLDPKQVHVLVIYSRTWDPPWGLLRVSWIRNFLSRFYEYEPQMDAVEARERLGLRQVMKWTRRGQWIEVYVKDGREKTYQVRFASPQKQRRPKTIAYHRGLKR